MDLSFAERGRRGDAEGAALRSRPDNLKKPSTLRVLWIDDEPDLLRIVVRFLVEEGCHVDLVNGGAEGLALARTRPYDVVLLDLVIAGTSGIQVLEAMRREDIRPPVLIVTGHGTPESGFDAGRLGAVSFLAKPLRGAELLAHLRAAVAGVDHDPSSRRTPGDHPHETDGVFGGPASARVASGILRIAESRHDVTTVPAWADLVGAAPATLENWCHAIGVRPRDALRFARLLRATIRFQRFGKPASASLDVADPRTLSHLAELAGGSGSLFPRSVGEFFVGQHALAHTGVVETTRQLLTDQSPDLA